jgi:tetraacyldisaccharide 4'-kinase
MRPPKFWRRSGGTARLLAPLGQAYALGARLRRQLTRPAEAGLPVICIGNLVAGGAGKTPTALAVAERLAALGHRPVFLTRGYGGSEAGPLLVDPARHDAAAVGDEALLLARRRPTVVARRRPAGAVLARASGADVVVMDDGFQNASLTKTFSLLVDPARHDAAAVGDEALLLARRCPTVVARRRPAGAVLARANGADVVVMDDGFQNPSLEKTLSLLVIDGEQGLGNGRVLPAGPLREPAAEGLARAQAVVLIGPADQDLRRRLAGREVLAARLEPLGENLAGRRVLAFAGIGRPEKFFATVAGLGAALVARRAFPDHHRYRPAELAGLRQAAQAAGALLITTEKDWMRLGADERQGIAALPVRLVFAEPQRLDRLLQKALAHG